MTRIEDRTVREVIWKKEEYTYEAAYGFVPNLCGHLHTDDRERDCMVIVPGGGYCMCVPPEADIAATAFFNQGMNVFVLTYTTDITMSVPLKKQPLQDISRAVRFLRMHEKEYHISGRKLILCGFSAGAHVSGTLAVHFSDVEDPDPAYDAISNRPDGVILSYPVITTGKYTHRDSIRALLGEAPSEQELAYFSLEKQVSQKTPPCFLWQTREDDLVPVENSYLFAQALLEKQIPFAHYVFPAGNHGLSIATEDFFAGNFGEEYTMEQVRNAVEAVRDGKGVRVSEKRRQELIRQFFGEDEMPEYHSDPSLKEDVGLWVKLAGVWMGRL